MQFAMNRLYNVRFNNKKSVSLLFTFLSGATHWYIILQGGGVTKGRRSSPNPPPLSELTKRTANTPKLIRSDGFIKSEVIPPSIPSTITQKLRSSRRGAVSVVISTLAPVYKSDIASLPSYHSGAPSGAPNNDVPSICTGSTSSSSINRPPTSESTTSHSIFHACRSHEVEHFLCTCNPSMISLLNSFLAFGCHNRDLLAQVASRSNDEIDDLLRMVFLKKPKVTMITEMDLFILKQHFKVYFAVGSGYD